VENKRGTYGGSLEATPAGRKAGVLSDDHMRPMMEPRPTSGEEGPRQSSTVAEFDRTIGMDPVARADLGPQ
jgi:hypothetical protein